MITSESHLPQNITNLHMSTKAEVLVLFSMIEILSIVREWSHWTVSFQKFKKFVLFVIVDLDNDARLLLRVHSVY